jgi:hypothetical protein
MGYHLRTAFAFRVAVVSMTQRHKSVCKLMRRGSFSGFVKPA